jgi:hypothetical protein
VFLIGILTLKLRRGHHFTIEVVLPVKPQTFSLRVDRRVDEVHMEPPIKSIENTEPSIDVKSKGFNFEGHSCFDHLGVDSYLRDGVGEGKGSFKVARVREKFKSM